MFADGCHWNNTLLYVDEILVSGFITWLSSLHLFSRGRVFWRAAGESNPGKYCAKIHLGMCSFFLISLGCFPAFPTSIFFAAFHARTCVCVCFFLCLSVASLLFCPSAFCLLPTLAAVVAWYSGFLNPTERLIGRAACVDASGRKVALQLHCDCTGVVLRFGHLGGEETPFYCLRRCCNLSFHVQRCLVIRYAVRRMSHGLPSDQLGTSHGCWLGVEN